MMKNIFCFCYLVAVNVTGFGYAYLPFKQISVLKQKANYRHQLYSTVDSRVLLDTKSSDQGLISSTIRGFNDRAAYDSQFKMKLTVEMIIGFITQLIAEISKRGAASLSELDFIIADLIMGLTANFFAVYLSAPSGRSTETKNDQQVGRFASFLSRCPDNAFQKCSPGSRFTMLERIFAIIKACPKLFAIGFVAMAIGSTATSILAGLRTLFDTAEKLSVIISFFSMSTIFGFMEIFKVSTAIGFYLAVSTNLRYQIIAGLLEGRILDPLFLQKYPNKLFHGIGTFVIRTCNTYLGSAMMVDFLRIVAIH